MQPKTSVVSTAVPTLSRSRLPRACVEREDAVTKWGSLRNGGRLNGGFECGEAFYEAAGNREKSEESGFGDVVSSLSVLEQRGAQQ